MANFVIHQPTNLETRLVAEREAADEAARAAVRAERQRVYDLREAALKAAKPLAPSTRTAPEPNQVAAEALRAALDDVAWSALLRHLEVWNPVTFKAALVFIAKGEVAMAFRAEQERGTRERTERQAADKAEAQAVLEARATELAA